MKGIIVVFISCLLCFQGLAQYNSQGDNTSRFRPGIGWFYTGLTPAKPTKPRKYDRLIFDVTYNDWNGDLKLGQNHWSSLGLNTNFMFDIPMTKGNKVSFGIGVSHSFFSIRHDRLILANNILGTTTIETNKIVDPVDVNRLNGHNFGIPIEFRFRNESWKHFKVHLGGKVGYQAALYSKMRFNSLDGKESYVIKSKNISDIEELTYSAHIRIGLRNWALFGSYNFNSIFSNSNSTQLNLVQFGLSISLF